MSSQREVRDFLPRLSGQLLELAEQCDDPKLSLQLLDLAQECLARVGEISQGPRSLQ